MTQASGASVVHETVYENRFGYCQTLVDMGADISLFRQCLGGKACRFALQGHLHSIVIKGATPLEGRNITIPDLRAGFRLCHGSLASKWDEPNFWRAIHRSRI